MTVDRRANYHYMAAKLAEQFRAWRREAPNRRENVPGTTTDTPRMGDMDDSQIDYWARRISAADAERSINMSNEAVGRSKARSGEAQ